MRHLNQVVQFRAFTDVGASHRGAVNTGVGTDFHVVFYRYNTYLRHLVISVGIGREAESVSSDDAARVDDDVIADVAVVINAHVRVYDAVVANNRLVEYRGVGIDLRVVANLHIIADIGEGTDVTVFSYLCFR